MFLFFLKSFLILGRKLRNMRNMRNMRLVPNEDLLFFYFFREHLDFGMKIEKYETDFK